MHARVSEAEVSDYLEDWSLKSWLTTHDHKRIGWLYMVSITAFFFVGGAAAALMRLNLLTPQGALVSADTYNRLFTAHGVIMVWMFLIPSIPSALGNFLMPMMIGARDLAFPRLNLTSWYIYVVGGLFTLGALYAGGVDTGWTFYTPFSTMFSNSNVLLAVTGVFIVGFSSILTGLNFIVTVHTMRAPGMTWFRLPLFVWANYATSIILVLATPVLAMTLALIAAERLLHIGIFDPALGGDPLLFQHLFWFYSHPAVYIMVLPAMGVASEIIPCFSRKCIFGYRFMAYAILGIASIGFLVWGHHMFVSGQSMYASMVFSLLSFLVAIPSAIKVFNWTATLYKGRITFSAPMLYALGFVGLFTIGGLAGLTLASLALDVHLTDTYYVIAHFHYIMVGGTVMAYLGGIHFWWPKMTGRMYPEMLGRAAALIIFFGFNLTFFPQYLLGLEGMPRRYHAYPPEFQVLNVLSSAGASILAVGYLLPMVYLTWSLFYGKRAGPNPWRATGLEWQTSSPPPKHNFEHTPIVQRNAYQYDPETGEEAPQ
ncbi:cytochrome c oxidase subunit I [Paraburkholderia rhynchosiae]|uniref:Cytochrome c oxidase subunit 1 n=1 Tax=Paraburkholderia rhynchosiae TaxID=487049 RepID=A0A2N7WS82_9BURK|nr:cytochrome c oxidase subunit I [Paraburkholderia rhynchosiae]PMS32289.1 cytochrome c oxidase subunit I [Paraburkholderia rhynchosiae]CAB3732387.1 putative cytochrome c oxidase subunit 1 [Paraburkholderia rhynchosiae]